MRWIDGVLAAAVAIGLAACGPERDNASAAVPGPVVIAAVGEPASILPPLAVETVARDIGDLVYQRLADLEPGKPPIDPAAYRPGLAERWERVDSLTWRFHLAPGARWADGEPVTAEDVRFSFDAFSDSVLDAVARPVLAGRVRVVVEDPHTFLMRFRETYPEQLYDATYHVRILPRHIWDRVPRATWAADTVISRLVGSGPYRVREWKRGQYLALEARDPTASQGRPRTLVWRFAQDPDAALNLVLAHEADLMELAAVPQGLRRVEADTAFRLVRYPSAAYGFLGFNLADSRGRPHPVLGDRATRRALVMAVDRTALARSAVDSSAVPPPGPMSRLLWIWSDRIRTLPFDPAAAARALDAAGWRRGAGGVRHLGGRALTFDILVPSTSSVRRQLAVELQAMWAEVGAKVTVTSVDFPVFQERLGRRRFDSYIGAWLDEPSPRGLADQWTRAGWDALNYGHYANPVFDSLFSRASALADPAAARATYEEAMDTLNADAPAVFLYTPTNAAAVSRRIGNGEIDPYSWLSGIADWRVGRSP
ncbi:MAG: peptide ABC transporter substrate-binding protein [Deltaproteobacteria bacterium]